MQQQILALKQQLTGGVSPAVATPLQTDGYTVNTAVIPQLVDFLINANVKGLFVGGTTGEGILLTLAERLRLHEAVVTAVNGRVPVLLHVGTNRLDHTLQLTQQAVQLNVAAIAAVTPYFYGINDASLITYFSQITQAAPTMPFLLYDIPHLAVNAITPALINTLTDTIPTLAGLKTSNTNAQVIRRQIDAMAPHHVILAGNESIALGSLALGANGLISGLSTALPQLFVALTSTFATGDITQARQLQGQINNILSFIPAGMRIGYIKQLLCEQGIDVGHPLPPRLPLTEKPLWPQVQEILT